MGKAKKVVRAVKKTPQVLDEPHEGKTRLAVRNISSTVQVIPAQLNGVAMPDLVLNLWAEQIVPAEWVQSGVLRRALMRGNVVGKWVDNLYLSPRIPMVEEAPAEVLPENFRERAFALDIVTSDTSNALELIDEKVELTPGRPNVKYLKENFTRVLEWVKWAEPQVQNRARVITAANNRIREIKAL